MVAEQHERFMDHMEDFLDMTQQEHTLRPRAILPSDNPFSPRRRRWFRTSATTLTLHAAKEGSSRFTLAGLQEFKYANRLSQTDPVQQLLDSYPDVAASGYFIECIAYTNGIS